MLEDPRPRRTAGAATRLAPATPTRSAWIDPKARFGTFGRPKRPTRGNRLAPPAGNRDSRRTRVVPGRPTQRHLPPPYRPLRLPLTNSPPSITTPALHSEIRS